MPEAAAAAAAASVAAGGGGRPAERERPTTKTAREAARAT